MAPQIDERIARREFMMQRKKSVLTTVAIGLAIAFVLAVAVRLHLLGTHTSQQTEASPNFGMIAPCPANTKDGTKAVYLDQRAIQVRVFNGTKFRGFAHAVGEALRIRGFNVTQIGNNATGGVKRTAIYFGNKSINAAYTLYANFTDAYLMMDNRKEAIVDVVLGSTFNNLRPKTDVPAAGAEIPRIKTCQNAKTMRNLPEAITQAAATSKN